MRTQKRFFDILPSWLLAFIFIVCCIQPACAKPAPYIPELLQPWVDWVLHGRETQMACVPQYNDADAYQCAWPSKLELDLTDRGGEFSQSWLIHRESWAALPGSGLHWPLDVQVDRESRVILQKDGAPVVHLLPGIHTITGRFSWTRLPENLQVPAGSGLVSLSVDQEKNGVPQSRRVRPALAEARAE